MLECSAGIIAYRKNSDNQLEVMLSHSGGPYYENDDRGWTIQKGGVEKYEDEEQAARREFFEETGVFVKEKIRKLGTFKVSKTKIVVVFFVKKDIDATKTTSNLFEIEWPPNSGEIHTYPENDKAEWFPIAEAKEKIFFGQVKILERLEEEVERLEKDRQNRKFIQKNIPKKKKKKKAVTYY